MGSKVHVTSGPGTSECGNENIGSVCGERLSLPASRRGCYSEGAEKGGGKGQRNECGDPEIGLGHCCFYLACAPILFETRRWSGLHMIYIAN